MRVSPARFAFWIALVSCLSVLTAKAQTNSPTVAPSPDQKAEAIIQRAIDVLGGSSYLSVQTVIGRGFYTAYKDGMSQLPTRFLDYIVFPDKERTEFTSMGIRVVQTNVGDTGWLYDGATKSINDQKATQIADFKRGMRTIYDNLLRGWWRKEKGVISYAGRREAGLAKRNETVRLTYPDGFWVEFEFGAKDGLPAKVIYKRTRPKADTDETEEVTEEDRLLKPITVDGVTAPFIIDHFINGQQSSRINYESVEYNRPVPDSLFVKPADPKKFK
ncbi:MAG TPA: hypothetical protein VFH31_09360 [Pyrinomonadaceae bacterium]|nr:hypothetical protein [Pyrinomonadaceae bacterium]